MQSDQKKMLKKILTIVGAVLVLISIIIRANRLYRSELPLLFGVLIIAFICLIIASKIKPDEDDDAAVAAPVAHKTWKCSCGSVNEADTLFCGECGNKKPVIQTPAAVNSDAAPKNWKCVCGAQNDKDSVFCWSCGVKKPC